MKRFLAFCASALCLVLPLEAQTLSLDSCRAMALRNNKQLGVARLKQDVTRNIRKSARTMYLPHVNAIGTYQYTSEEISILNDTQKQILGSLGTGSALAGQLLSGMSTTLGKILTAGSPVLNILGQRILEDFRTDTHHLVAGTVMLTQPVFMGGAIIAMNKMATLSERMADNSAEASRQTVLYATDQAYWQVVSLKHKKRLAESYLSLVRKLDGDVQKMIAEGVATRSEGLNVSVKVNEAEVALRKVDDGLVLSKMLLCQMTGLPINQAITLADEDREVLETGEAQPLPDVSQAVSNRAELRALENIVDIAKQTTNVMRAGNLPQIALTGGYAVTNPNLFNGFERKFRGFWNAGVLVRIPLWNWGDVMYKVRAAKSATAMANLELEDAREKIELQVNQAAFKVDEANKRLAMAEASIKRADENLRIANLGFQEGVVSLTVVIEAQTAWLQAQSEKIDAEIDVKLSQTDLRKALGTLQ
jgi:outer membrane protein TolC